MTATADATDSSTVEQLAQAVSNLEKTVERQAERIDELENELAQHKDHTGREFADVRGRITDVEDTTAAADTRRIDESEPEPDAQATQTETEIETPLERICALPEHVADQELTANQERARFIARDIRDYAEKAPAGLVVDSRAIKRVYHCLRGETPSHANCGPCHGFPR